MEMSEENPGTILSKTQSLRDKMKKRRKAIESLMTGDNKPGADDVVSASSADTHALPKKSKSDIVVSESKSEQSEEKTVSDRLSPVVASSHTPEKSQLVTKSSSNPADDLTALLSLQSAKEREERSQQDEIFSLLSQPTAREQSLLATFKSVDGGGVKEFCQLSTKVECCKVNRSKQACDKLHFVKILQKHTDESLGDCSFLNTCFHMDTCKYIHYEVDKTDVVSKVKKEAAYKTSIQLMDSTKLVPPQWIQCDLRNFKFDVLGKFSVLMADPPWDIHMELPYGTMSDDEMRRLPVPDLQDEGLIFLWVTGRAMELGRECLKLWGYERVDEIIWVKTNQLQRIIRTGRTGHWLNHGKEHCLVGEKGHNQLNRGLDCDVIVAEVRATSHKPDEIYGIIERLSPGTRKIELFGRPHNLQPNWVTLGNQLDGVMIHDKETLDRWSKIYPDGYNITENFILHPRQE